MTPDPSSPSLAQYVARATQDPQYARDSIRQRCAAIAAQTQPAFILSVSVETALRELDEALCRLRGGVPQPLFGVPFAVKDNLDVAGLPTTAGCPSFAYTPGQTASAVQSLLDAGAILLGKTNMDQFATGLVGTRSPFGACHAVHDARFISGGSSSGSAVAVAQDWVGFALGTDTAGSGRVPAALNDIVGLKPSCGLVSTRGLVPACRSLDCVSIFTRTCADAELVLESLAHYDREDPFARPVALDEPVARPRRVGVPPPEQLEFCDDADAQRLFSGVCERAKRTGLTLVPIDFAPFRQVAELLYAGPWVAERYAAVGHHIASGAADLDPTVTQIIRRGATIDGVATFRGLYELTALRRASEQQWSQMDVLLLPTTPTTYTIQAVARDPVGLNSTLGHYTNFVNLLELTAVAIPAGFRADGLPLGATLVGPAGSDRTLLRLGATLGRPEPPIPAP